MDCSQCGATLPDAAKFCPQCGTAVGSAPGIPSPAVQQGVGVVKDNGAVMGSIQGSVGPVHVGGQQHYGNRITASHGSAVSTSSGVTVAGNRNVVVTGKVGGDAMVGGASLENFRALLADLREQLTVMQAQGMSADDSADIEAELDEGGELTQCPEPPAKRIVRALEKVKDILEAAGVTAAAALTVMPLVNQAIQMAQTLFGH